MITDFWTGLKRSVEDFVFPPSCAWCFNPLPQASQKSSSQRLCQGCQVVLGPAIPHRCPRCSASIGPYVARLDGCPVCREESFSFERIISLGIYQEDLQSACLRCKRTIDPYLGVALTELFWKQEQESLAAVQADVVVPVPHHWTDRMGKPFQLSDLIAEWLGRFLMRPVGRHILAKNKRTPKQLTLPMSARRRNLRSAFRVPRGLRIDGATVLLVDDIVTTGTTVHRAARELVRVGAGRVIVAALARGTGS
ncbi:MAG: ComF family protein [Planctomycetaceae bacterium]|nr:ComF family protein [Planctomycetaceae bacterium]